MKGKIEGQQLLLIACDIPTLENAIAGNEQLAKYLDVLVPDNWTEFGVAALNYSIEKLNQGPHEQGWWTYFPIHKTDNRLIGTCGYKGKPNAEGEVEIGYEIAPDYRNKGLATELANTLVKNAFSFDEVRSVTAHTLGTINASTKVLSKCGFSKIAELKDDDAGIIWKWELKRN
jgi:[ribosomal protein S5]-alanine N-acetyltransferase